MANSLSISIRGNLWYARILNRRRMAASLMLAAWIAVLAPASGAAQSISKDTARVIALDDANTIGNELAPAWDEDSGEPNGTFYFERSASWYLDTAAHQLYRATIVTPRANLAGEFWHLALGAVPFALDGLPAERFEVVPVSIPGCGGTQLLYCGAADRAKVASGSGDRADIHLYVREHGRFVQKDGAAQIALINGSNSWESHPAASKNVIFFSSDRPGGKGGLDIWYVVFDGVAWHGPVNASELNTPYSEAFPFLPPDNARTLYFSSDRPRSDGGDYGFDIYVAHRDYSMDGVNPPDTLHYTSMALMNTINTRYNEIGYAAIDDQRGFYASDSLRTQWGGKRNFDLYQVVPNPNPPEPVDRQSILAVDRCDPAHPPVDMEFDVVDVSNSSETVVAAGRVNDQTGRATIRFLNTYRENSGEFILRPRAGDRYFSVPIRIRPARRLDLDTIPLYPVDYRAGCPINFRSLVQFESGTSILSPDDLKRLAMEAEQVERYLRGLPGGVNVRLTIDGHTDDRPTTYRGVSNGMIIKGESDPRFNQLLSDDRAAHVREFLTSRLASMAGRITFVSNGFAATQPKVPPYGLRGKELDDAREQNRRVEVRMELVSSGR